MLSTRIISLQSSRSASCLQLETLVRPIDAQSSLRPIGQLTKLKTLQLDQYDRFREPTQPQHPVTNQMRFLRELTDLESYTGPPPPLAALAGGGLQRLWKVDVTSFEQPERSALPRVADFLSGLCHLPQLRELRMRWKFYRVFNASDWEPLAHLTQLEYLWMALERELQTDELVIMVF